MSEIGSFLKAIIEIEKVTKTDSLTSMWMASNLDYKALNEICAEINPRLTKSKPNMPGKPEQDTAKVNKDWQRLKMFMAGKK